MLARVVDLPIPVAPTTNTTPRLSSASSSTIGGELKDASKGSLRLQVTARSKATLLKEQKRVKADELRRLKEHERALALEQQHMNIQSDPSVAPISAIDGRRASHQSTAEVDRVMDLNLLNQNSEYGGSQPKLGK